MMKIETYNELMRIGREHFNFKKENMITVTILINNKPIYTRTAVNRTEEVQPSNRDLYNSYIVDDGTKILHSPDDGAVKLAIEMLKTIKEVQ